MFSGKRNKINAVVSKIVERYVHGLLYDFFE